MPVGATGGARAYLGTGRRGSRMPNCSLVPRPNDNGDLFRKVGFSSCVIDGRLLCSALGWLRWSVSLVVVAPGEERAPPEVDALFFWVPPGRTDVLRPGPCGGASIILSLPPRLGLSSGTAQAWLFVWGAGNRADTAFWCWFRAWRRTMPSGPNGRRGSLYAPAAARYTSHPCLPNPRPEWRNWQTRGIQNPVGATQ